MSDIGLYGSIYGRLRLFADRFDQALIQLRSTDAKAAGDARKELTTLLRAIADSAHEDAASKTVAALLKRELPRVSGKGIEQCSQLAAALEGHSPSEVELGSLEAVAGVIDRECSAALGRLTGRR